MFIFNASLFKFLSFEFLNGVVSLLSIIPLYFGLGEHGLNISGLMFGSVTKLRYMMGSCLNCVSGSE